jgi:hypothetical protein
MGKEIEYTLRTESRRGEYIYTLYHKDDLIIQTTHKPTVMQIVKQGWIRALPTDRLNTARPRC